MTKTNKPKQQIMNTGKFIGIINHSRNAIREPIPLAINSSKFNATFKKYSSSNPIIIFNTADINKCRNICINMLKDAKSLIIDDGQ